MYVANIPPDNIHVVVGQMPIDADETISDVPHHFRQYAGVDNNGYFWMLEEDNPITSKWIFLIHDTTVLGSSFWRAVQVLAKQAEENDVEMVKVSHQSMSMGLIKVDVLKKHKDKISAMINYDHTRIREIKMSVDDSVFNIIIENSSPDFRFATLQIPFVLVPGNVVLKYNNGYGVDRILEYNKFLDMFKAKSWYGQSIEMPSEITKP
jgi:hypothetical protein